MNETEIRQAVWKKEAEYSLQQEFEQSLSERVQRLSELNTAWMIPNHHFAPASAECILLFRDGHYHGCISLVQSVTEALARFLCEKNNLSPKEIFEQNVLRLFRRGLINAEFQGYFEKIWVKRNDYHHLNSNIAKDRQILRDLAKENLNLLHKIQQEIFRFNICEGKVVPRYPKYWDTFDGTAFIQIEATTRWVFK